MQPCMAEAHRVYDRPPTITVVNSITLCLHHDSLLVVRSPLVYLSWLTTCPCLSTGLRPRAGQVGCYALYADGTKPWKVTSISLKTGRAAVLHPPKGIRGPPTVFLGSFPMHRISTCTMT